eukprot:212849-Prorocentrum_minimum.AAC.1
MDVPLSLRWRTTTVPLSLSPRPPPSPRTITVANSSSSSSAARPATNVGSNSSHNPMVGLQPRVQVIKRSTPSPLILPPIRNGHCRIDR